MKLNNLLTFLLTEDKFSDALQANPEISPILQGFKGIQPKYLPWLVKQIKANKEQDWGLVKNLLAKFEMLASANRLKEKDINKYKTVEDIQDAIETTSNQKTNKEKRQEIKSGAERIYEDSEWLIIEPETMEASCYYGYGTRWCISATESENYFESYRNRNIKFVFAINKKNNEKYAYAVSSEETEIFNKEDKTIISVPVNDKIIDIINDYMEKKHGLKVKKVDFKKYIHLDTSPEELLSSYNSSEDPEKRYLILNQDFPLDKISEEDKNQAFAILAKDQDRHVRISVAKNPNTSPETLSMLAKDTDRNVREWVAENRNTSPETLSMLAQDKDWHVRVWVSKNRNTPAEALSMLAKDQDLDVLEWVARNPNTTAEALSVLAKNRYLDLRKWVARNPNTSPETLSILVKDQDRDVREGVSKNPNASPETLSILAKDLEFIIRISVAENPNASPEALSLLAQDKNEDVRIAAKKALDDRRNSLTESSRSRPARLPELLSFLLKP